MGVFWNIRITSSKFCKYDANFTDTFNITVLMRSWVGQKAPLSKKIKKQTVFRILEALEELNNVKKLDEATDPKHLN